jgi:transcriptional regulator with XRE-family HTH domain
MCYEQNRLAMSNIAALRSVGEVDSGSENDIQILIGANLKRLRKLRGLSRWQLAHLAQVERSALRQLECGAITPSVGMLWKLARELQVPCADVIEATMHRPDSWRTSLRRAVRLLTGQQRATSELLHRGEVRLSALRSKAATMAMRTDAQ